MKPQFRIMANGVVANINDRRLSLEITDERGIRSDEATLSMDNRDGLIAPPRQGVELEIFLGYEETGLVRMGLYKVDEVEERHPPRTMSIKAKAADMRASLKQQKTRSFDGVTFGDLVARVAADHGLAAKVDAQLASIALGHVDQTEESDMNLVTRLAEENDAVAKPAGGALVVVRRGEGVSATGRPMPKVGLAATDLLSWHVKRVSRPQHKTVKAAFHDFNSAARTEITVGQGEGPSHTIRGTCASADEAARAADGRLDTLVRSSWTFSCTCPGNPALAAEAKLNIQGIGTLADGAWIVTRVVHRLDGHGYVSEVEAERPRGVAASS